MKILLDTHLLLWATSQSARLPAAALALLADTRTQPVYSSASLWEIAVKRGLGRTSFLVDPRVLRRSLIDNDYEELAITGEHTLAIGGLPAIHKDPFDRILVAQSIVEGITLLTADSTLARYPGPIRLV